MDKDINIFSLCFSGAAVTSFPAGAAGLQILVSLYILWGYGPLDVLLCVLWTYLFRGNFIFYLITLVMGCLRSRRGVGFIYGDKSYSEW